MSECSPPGITGVCHDTWCLVTDFQYSFSTSSPKKFKWWLPEHSHNEHKDLLSVKQSSQAYLLQRQWSDLRFVSSTTSRCRGGTLPCSGRFGFLGILHFGPCGKELVKEVSVDLLALRKTLE